MRHTWINDPSPSKQTCTRCGCKKEKGGTNSQGAKATIYFKWADQLDHAPKCE